MVLWMKNVDVKMVNVHVKLDLLEDSVNSVLQAIINIPSVKVCLIMI